MELAKELDGIEKYGFNVVNQLSNLPTFRDKLTSSEQSLSGVQTNPTLSKPLARTAWIYLYKFIVANVV